MAAEQKLAAVLLLGLLVFAVVSDIRRHRIPNVLILLGLTLALVGQVYAGGFAGLGSGMLGLLIGFSLFLPFYATGGMAAGDVKLMAMAGSFLSPTYAMWMTFFSLIAGGLCGLAIILIRGQLPVTLSRYWAIFLARSYVAPSVDEVAGKPFPYSIAILLGVLLALVWQPFDPLQYWELVIG